MIGRLAPPIRPDDDGSHRYRTWLQWHSYHQLTGATLARDPDAALAAALGKLTNAATACLTARPATHPCPVTE